jgi:hypothetical protein
MLINAYREAKHGYMETRKKDAYVLILEVEPNSAEESSHLKAEKKIKALRYVYLMLPAIVDRKVVMGSEMSRPDCNMTVVGNKNVHR